MYLVSCESRDKSLLEWSQPMVGPDETLVQQFRVRGCLGINRLQLEHHHIFTPNLLVSLLFLELVSRLRWSSRDALTFITHSTQLFLRILVHISRFIARGGTPPRDLTLYCQTFHIIPLEGTLYANLAVATHLAKSHHHHVLISLPAQIIEREERRKKKSHSHQKYVTLRIRIGSCTCFVRFLIFR